MEREERKNERLQCVLGILKLGCLMPRGHGSNHGLS